MAPQAHTTTNALVLHFKILCFLTGKVHNNHKKGRKYWLQFNGFMYFATLWCHIFADFFMGVDLDLVHNGVKSFLKWHVILKKLQDFLQNVLQKYTCYIKE